MCLVLTGFQAGQVPTIWLSGSLSLSPVASPSTPAFPESPWPSHVLQLPLAAFLASGQPLTQTTWVLRVTELPVFGGLQIWIVPWQKGERNPLGQRNRVKGDTGQEDKVVCRSDVL